MLGYLLPRRLKPGRRPGALVNPAPEHRVGKLSIQRLDYGGQGAPVERCGDDLDRLLTPGEQGGHKRLWLHFEGDVTAAQLTRLGKQFSLHPLALEDVLNDGQRPKLDAYPDVLFITLVLPHVVDGEAAFQQVSLFVGDHFVFSFHAGEQDIFAPIRERIRTGRGRVVQADSDYLGYCLADIVVDSGFPVLGDYQEQLDGLENEIFEDRSRDLIGVIHALRQRLIGLRKVFRAQSDMLLRWVGLEHALIHAENRPYLRDAHDHAKRASDLADGYYDTTRSLLDTHLSLASARLNDVMRMLTLIATIFMPLSFLAGVYGMNFDPKSPWNMPELSFAYGYPVLLGFMLLLVIGMLAYFRRKRWL